MKTVRHTLQQLRWQALLLLALLLPLAQAAAQWHGVGHWKLAQTQTQDGDEIPGQRCDFCLAADVVGGAAVSTAHQTWVPLELDPDLRAAPLPTALPRSSALAYRSRAPPFQTC